LTALSTPRTVAEPSAHTINVEAPAFDSPHLPAWLQDVDDAALDRLECGALGFDAQGILCQYNKVESAGSGVDAARLLGQNVFVTVAPCMNNFMVAQRLDDALQQGVALDDIVDFVLTWRMRPTHVKLRLVATPGMRLRYVLVERRVATV
jgi:photoactive yellow protein